jgi:hypothetical protein
LRLSSNVVDAISNGFAEFLVDEVVHIDFIRATFRPIIAASVLVVVDQPFLLGIDRDHRLAFGQRRRERLKSTVSNDAIRL